MQCFHVGYHGICHASLVFSVTHEPLGGCVYKENKSDKFYIYLQCNAMQCNVPQYNEVGQFVNCVQYTVQYGQAVQCIAILHSTIIIIIYHTIPLP